MGHSFLAVSESGQATTEYVLLLVIIVSAFVAFAAALSKLKLDQALMKPLTQGFAHAYRYGAVNATGPEDPQGAFNHPRFPVPVGENFRLFINPNGGKSGDGAQVQ
jgi:hypothetical protein